MVTKTVMSTTSILTTDEHRSEDQNYNTTTLTSDETFVTEGDANSPTKQPLDAANDENPLLEEYFQPTLERQDDSELNQTNNTSVLAMNTQQKEAAPVKDRWKTSQKRAAHIAAKREEARSKMAYSLQ